MITINNFPFLPDSRTPSGGIGTFGELSRFENGIAGFYGQSFTSPSTGDALSLAFAMETYPRDLQQGPTKYRVLLTTAPSPSNPLFTSPELFLPAGSPWTEISVNLNGTPLIGGQTYFWILDGYSDRNGLTGDAMVGTRNDYAGGAFYYGTTDLGGSMSGIDLAFQVTLQPTVPEPTTWTLLLFGLLTIGALRWRHI